MFLTAIEMTVDFNIGDSREREKENKRCSKIRIAIFFLFHLLIAGRVVNADWRGSDAARKWDGESG